MTAPLDFVTVTYKKELNILRAQAISFSRKVDPGAVGKIYVILNDTSLSDNDLNPIVALYGQHAANVVVIRSDSVAPNLASWTHGWWAQQILKLRISQMVTSEYYVVIDSKNHFTKYVDTSTFISDDERIKTWEISYLGNSESHFRGSFKYFGIDPEKYISKLPPSITPITLRTQTARDLIDYIERRANTTFEIEFLREREVTEFLAYYAFIIHSGKTLDDEYVYVKPQVATIFVDKLKDESTFKSIMHQARESSRIMFGVHWAAAPVLQDEHKAKIIEFWKESGLFVSDEEALLWLDIT
jgi:hypothetical protein